MKLRDVTLTLPETPKATMPAIAANRLPNPNGADGENANVAHAIPRSPKPAVCLRFGRTATSKILPEHGRKPHHHAQERLQSRIGVRTLAPGQARWDVDTVRLLPRGGRRR